MTWTRSFIGSGKETFSQLKINQIQRGDKVLKKFPTRVRNKGTPLLFIGMQRGVKVTNNNEIVLGFFCREVEERPLAIKFLLIMTGDINIQN
jgi:hypothetical protein